MCVRLGFAECSGKYLREDGVDTSGNEIWKKNSIKILLKLKEKTHPTIKIGRKFEYEKTSKNSDSNFC